MSDPKILVVADSDEASHLTSVLRDAGLSLVETAHGGEGTLEAFEKNPADIVVLAATLEEVETDVQEFCEALHSTRAPAPCIVLVGDEHGPVRTALDAMEFGIDRFLRRPLSPKALAFAVRSCVTTDAVSAASNGQVIGGLAMGVAQGHVNMIATLGETSRAKTGPGARPGTASGGVGAHAIETRIERRIAKATSEAIDEFINDAVNSVLATAPQAPAQKSHIIEQLDADWEDAWLAPFKEPSPVAAEPTDAAKVIETPDVGDLVPAVVQPESQVRRAEELSPGSLHEGGAALVLSRMYRDQFTGSVSFRRAEAKKTIFFDQGRPVFATSNLPHDRMGDLLYREGKITREQYNEGRDIVADTGRRMGEMLVEMGFLKRRELLPAVRRHVKDIVYSLFAWQMGHYQIDADEHAASETIRLADDPVALVLEGVRRKMGLSRLKKTLGDPTIIIATIDGDELAAALSEVDLSADEQTTVELFDAHRSLMEVIKATPLTETTVYQLAYGLVAAGLATVHASAEEARTGMITVSAPAGDTELKIDRERIMARHALIVDADYFAVLGVRRDASEFEIQRAYETARTDYAAEAFPGQLQTELAAQLKEIVLVLQEAYQVLRDDRVRERYAANLQE